VELIKEGKTKEEEKDNKQLMSSNGLNSMMKITVTSMLLLAVLPPDIILSTF
jgi:hypothetical protein